MPDWYFIRSFIKRKFNIDETIVDYIAVIDILELCVAGKSNTSICRILDLDKEYLDEVLTDYLSFKGLETDLDFYPIIVYEKARGSQNTFETLCYTLDYFENLDELYNACMSYLEVKKEVDKFYAKQ